MEQQLLETPVKYISSVRSMTTRTSQAQQTSTSKSLFVSHVVCREIVYNSYAKKKV